jgi:outer membrane protein assembly factor BamB
LSETGVQGGLIVHLGCGDGRLTAALRVSDRYVVHGMDVDSDRIAEARKHIRSLGVYGPVAVEHWTSQVLPYADYSVNLIVADNPRLTTMEELKRVLVPLGVAYIKSGDNWKKIITPAREGVDEWTHFLHDASGNPVAHDSVVAPPRHLQWTAGPRHSRSHEFTPSINAVVSASGRLFYVADQGPIATLRKPAEWKLVARDAYNGLFLWERPISQWFSHLYGWTQGPRQLQRKLVAIGDRVYVTLGYHAPLTALDAATGETLKTFPDTEGTEEILYHQGTLLIVIRKVTETRLAAYKKWEELTAKTNSPIHLRDTRTPWVSGFRTAENSASKRILALDPETGETLWALDEEDCSGLKTLSLRAAGNRVYCEKNNRLSCLDFKSGETLWEKQASPLRTVTAEAVVCVDKDKITMRNPEDGSVRWTQDVTLASIRDVLIAGGALWLGGGRPYDTGNAKHTGPLWGPYFAIGRDLASGEIIKEITSDNPKHHHRCYENKATDQFILGGRRGTEFLDLKSGNYLWHSWARGTCRYGVMPCNGMLYVPPHACGCYITVKLMGFNALVPERVASQADELIKSVPTLQRGPAFGEAVDTGTNEINRDVWPMYRGNAERSSHTKSTVPTALTTQWCTDLAGPITAPTAAGGLVYVAQPDQHQVLALDATTGKVAWTYTSNGRIDSPPSLHAGLVLFGCRDGYVYCLRGKDGELVWRFRAAPDPRRIVASSQLESASPVHGSVLIDGDQLAFVAGRSSYLDGGLKLYRLEPKTGEVLSQTDLYSPDPITGEQPDQYGPNSMPGARSDILAADGQFLYLRDTTFSKQGVELTDREPHLFTLTDFLDDSWAHRSYWIFGTESSISTGCSGRDRKLLYGRLLAFDPTTVYGYGRSTVHWSSEFEDGEYRIFARKRSEEKPVWSKSVPVHVQALVQAGNVLFVAGAGPAPSSKPDKQSVSDTPLVIAISTADGSELARYPIAAAPIFDGMGAADGKLLLALQNGSVLCLGGK